MIASLFKLANPRPTAILDPQRCGPLLCRIFGDTTLPAGGACGARSGQVACRATRSAAPAAYGPVKAPTACLATGASQMSKSDLERGAGHKEAELLTAQGIGGNLPEAWPMRRFRGRFSLSPAILGLEEHLKFKSLSPRLFALRLGSPCSPQTLSRPASVLAATLQEASTTSSRTARPRKSMETSVNSSVWKAETQARTSLFQSLSQNPCVPQAPKPLNGG